MLNLNSIMLGSSNVKEMTEFYEKILDKATMVNGEWHGWQAGSCFFSVGPHSEVKGSSKEPSRIIFNLETNEVKKEAERIKELGAKVIAEAYELDGMLIATFADPDGNYFQLMSPWQENQ